MHYGPLSANHADVLTYRRAADAFRNKDLATLAAAIHEDVTWHFPGSSFLARSFKGRDGLLEYLKELLMRTHGTFILEDVAISGTDHHVVAVQRLGATHNGSTEKFDAISIMRFEDGKQIERWFHLVDLDAFDTFFAKFE